MNQKYFRSTINQIPENRTLLQTSGIPFVITVTPELFVNDNVPFSEQSVIRCENCKTYLNPFVEIIAPGTLWKCNMCFFNNKVDSPFKTTQAYSSSYSVLDNQQRNMHSKNLDLQALNIDVIAPASFSLRPPSEPVYLFLIEATTHSIKSGLFQSILQCLFNNLSIIKDTSNRTKIIICFFNTTVHILRKREGAGFLVVTDFNELPSFMAEDILFKKEEINVEIPDMIEYFMKFNESGNDLGGALKVINRILNSGTVIAFLSTVPNLGEGKINIEKGNLKCKSQFYKNMATEFTQNQVAINFFLFSNLNIELPTLSILSKFTGGSIFYYPSFNPEIFSFNSRFLTDFCTFFEQNIGFESVCKIRVPDGVKIKEYFGNFTIRQNGIIALANYYPGHSITFEIEITETFQKTDLTVQVATLRTLESGIKVLRIINFVIQKGNDFYNTLNCDQLIHYGALKAIYHEAIQKGNGNEYLKNFIKNISFDYKKMLKFNQKGLLLPESLELMPLKTLSLMKSIPLRPNIYTPMDFRAYYIYLFYTQYPSFINKLILPSLYALHLIDGDEGLILENKVIMPQPVRLTLNLLETSGLYLMDTGTNFYFFVGRECDPMICSLILEDADGYFCFTKYENELSLRVNNIVDELRKDRYIAPGFQIIKDSNVQSVFIDIFFGYFIEDAVHGLPDLNTFINEFN